MIKAQIAAEPEVEDLLASIRKAITDEAGLPPAGTAVRAGGASIGGSMRQSRVKVVDEAGGARAGEILELRNKISNQLARKDAETVVAARPAVSPVNGFAGILGGSVEPKSVTGRPTAPADPMSLRESLERVESAGHREHEAIYQSVERQNYQSVERQNHQEFERRAAEAQHDWHQPRYLPPADLRPGREAYSSEAGMMSQDAAAVASSAFNRLAETLMARATGERPIEDITRELLRTMLKQWLDEHLPGMVERLVREEIERVARRGPLR